MKMPISMLTAALFAAATSFAAAQSPSSESATKKADDFAAKEKALQDASKSSASSSGTPPATEASKYKPSGKDTMNTMQSNQTFKGSKPVDKNAKAQAPVKDVKQMTPEERAERRKEIAKEAKP